MTLTRVLVPGVLLLPGVRIELDYERAHHVRDVLRHVVGSRLVVFDGAGAEAEATVSEVSADEVLVQVTALREAAARSPCSVTLLVALLKGDKLDWVLEKATELGVGALVPVETEHAVVQLRGERAASRLVRWQRIVEGAARQCERADVPRVAPVGPLVAALERFGEGAALRLFCQEREEGAQGADALLARAREAGGAVVIAVGPEGGFSAAEQAAARALGYLPFTLGRRILRAETAALTAVAVVQRALGELG